MASTLSAMVVIACPRCGTRYRLASDALGRKGRKVTCAHCSETWQAKPESALANDPDQLFSEEEEAALDAAFTASEAAHTPAPASFYPKSSDPEGPMRSIADIKSSIAPRSRPTAKLSDMSERSRQKAFARRQAAHSKQSPLARVRRVLRLVGVTVLISLIVGAVALRTEIVKQFPDLAGAYEALGLGVNVVGLEFRDVTTLVALKSGSNLLRVDARIYSVAARRLNVPPVVVTLLDSNGAALYEWSVTPDTRELAPGEVADFTTQLSTPPAGAARVRLTFSNGKARTESSLTAATPSN